MGSTSDAKHALFGEIGRYTGLLRVVAERLMAKYSDEAFRPFFRTLPERSICIAPMVLCDALSADLGARVPDHVLQALGAMCFHISTHDDVVDERPRERRKLAALTYTGNLAFHEGIRLLRIAREQAVREAILERIAENHVLQQRCVAELWEAAPRSFTDYRHGIDHDRAFTWIGIAAALAWTERSDLQVRLDEFCLGYGVAFQLLDDIAEVREDTALGYHSFPLLEGPPYAESLRQIDVHLRQAEEALDPAWSNLRKLIEYPRRFAQRLHHAIR